MINVNVDGVKDALDTVKEIVIPWQKEQAERKSKLENAMRHAEVQRLNAETLAERAKIEQGKSTLEINKAQVELISAQAKKTEAEAKLVLAQAEKAFAEAEKERENMKLERIKLAERIVEKYNPSATGAEKINFIIRLLPDIDRLLSSGVELINI
jgi:hypothetical protein